VTRQRFNKYSHHALTQSLALCSFLVLNSAAVYSQAPDKDLRTILELQDTRSLGNGTLISYLQSKDKGLRYQACIALANLQDTSTIEPLVPLLQDDDMRVRAAAGFALGQIGTLASQKPLEDALTKNQDSEVLGRIFEALGKCGNAEGLASVIAFVPSAKNMVLKRDQALSIARFAIRHITSERGVWLCFDLLKDNHSETRWAALYALWRSAPFGLIDLEISKHAYLLSRLMNDEDADVRINLAELLGRTRSEDAPLLLKSFSAVEAKNPDWRVQVQLIRSIAALVPSQQELYPLLLDFLTSSNDHVRITSLISLGSLRPDLVGSLAGKERLITTLKRLATTSSPDAILVQGEAIVALGRLFPVELEGLLPTLETTLKDNLLRSKVIEALSYYPTEPNLRYVLHSLQDDSVRVKMAGWDFLRRMIQPRTLQVNSVDSSLVDSLPVILTDRMHSALKNRDLAVTTLVAILFADSTVEKLCREAGRAEEIEKEFRSVYPHLSSSEDAEAQQMVQQTFVALKDTSAIPLLKASLADVNRTVALGASKALKLLRGIDYPVLAPAEFLISRSESDWKLLDSIRPGQRVTFRTTKGSFSLRLLKQYAPFTVLAFVKLVKEKFYDGLTFHRVVPDFVIQGGDPRGDGWGGPGFTLRSEWSLVNFERGTVGMASSGKDTEGCQFFITHIPTPHLDGKYTIFARVSSGMQVVDRIQVGDRIISAEIR
jgi:cyclophilin family peptidyl-prolyl cis-trans isomerase/HEAT repeat protein